MERNRVWQIALKMNQEVLYGFAVTRNSTQLFYSSQLNIHLFVVNYFYNCQLYLYSKMYPFRCHFQIS